MLAKIQKHLMQDGVIIHATDTVCGISGSYRSKKAYHTIFLLKKRQKNKPLAILIANLEMIPLFSNIPLASLEPLIPFLQRGMTLVIKRKNSLPQHLLDQSAFIALRIPNHPQTLSIIHRCGPLICTSANISGKPPIESKKESKKYFGDNVLFIDGEMPTSNNPSTIISFIDGNYQLLREGNISKEEIGKFIPLSF